jgi:hypothetical protein
MVTDIIAQRSGYSSGSEMVQEILNAPTVEERVKSIIDGTMEQYADIRNTPLFKQAAEEAVHSAGSVELMALEREVFKASLVDEKNKARKAVLKAMQKADEKLLKEWLNAKESRMVEVAAEKAVKKERRSKKRLRPERSRWDAEEERMLKRWLAAPDEATRKKIEEEFRSHEEVSAKKAITVARFEYEFVRDLSHQRIASMPVSQAIDARTHLAAERKAAVSVAKALESRDYEAAAKYKRQQAISHALASEAMKARRDVDRWFNYLREAQTAKRETFKTDEHFAQVAELLRRFGFERHDGKMVARSETLTGWITRMNEVTNTVDIADWITESSDDVEWRKLPVEKLRDVKNAIANIRRVAMMENKAYIIFDKMDIDEIAKQLSIQQSLTQSNNKSAKLTTHLTAIEKLLKQKDVAREMLINVETMLRALDGFKAFGPWWRAFYEHINNAQNKQIAMISEAAQKYSDIFSVYTKEELKRMNEQLVYIPELKESLTKNEIIAMALNWGNKDNRFRLCAGRKGWSEPMVQSVLDQYLNKRDWDTVQNVWDMIESYWSSIAELYRDLVGFAPVKVEAETVYTQYGNYRGGYYPLKGDPRHVLRSLREVEEGIALNEGNIATWKASTRNGHAKGRVQGARYPVTLDINLIQRHITDVVHDLCFRKVVIDLNRLLNNDMLKNSLADAYGINTVTYLDRWLKGIAGQNPEQSRDMLDHIAASVRKRTTVVALGMRIGSMFEQLTGFLPAVVVDDKFGIKEVTHGIISFYGKALNGFDNVKESAEFVMNKSKYMQHRISTLDRDISSAAHRAFSKDDAMMRFSMHGIGFFDKMVTVPVWLEAYRVGLKEYENNDQKAIDYADLIVRRSQGSGLTKDLPEIMRKGEFKKLITIFYSYMSQQLNNIYEISERKRMGIDDWGDTLGKILAMWLVPVTLGQFLKGRFNFGDDGEPGENWKTLLKSLLSYPFSMVPVVRDVADFLLDIALNTGFARFRPSPIVVSVDDIGRLLAVAQSEEASGQDVVEAGAKVAAFVGPYPDQFNALLFNMVDIVNGMQPKTEDILRRRPKRNR